MSSVEFPHFGLPFNIGPMGANVNEQDSLEDVAACVVAILSTHLGDRDEIPEFGIPDFTFQKMPIGADDILAAIGNQEPRAVLAVEERPGGMGSDHLVDLINVGVSLYQKGNVI